MAIGYDGAQRLFKLDTEETTYMIALSPEGYVGHVYYGERLYGAGDTRLLRMEEAPCTPSVNEGEKASFMDFFPMEYPTGGVSDYRESCLEVRGASGGPGCELLYMGHEIYKGKKRLAGLPASFGTEEEAETLEIRCGDAVLGLEVVLGYSVFEKENIIARSVRVENRGGETLRLEKVYSACIDMDNEDYEMLTLCGSWARERHIQTRPLAYGKQSVASAKGESSHQQHPFMALISPGCTQEHGEVYAMHFVYSGNFLAQAELTQFDAVRMVLGISPEGFCWVLRPGETFQAPEVVLTYSGKGLGQMTRSYHDFYRSHLIRSSYRDKKRPILINNWEATY
ncbi:MAG TPA: alpha-galactosidase, partial [Lachnospiraceae bacterium]|nr:alpha-galactosidase [Lachnospiraceae bacterium]